MQCWGNNFNGQLGNNSNSQSLVSVQVIGLTSGVTAVAAGGTHSCAVVNGAVQCWGDNSSGQLGNNNAPLRSNVPVQPTGINSGVTAVAAGDGHSCAAVSGGVQCWGFNNSGQLGNNSIILQSLLPVQVTGLTSGVTAVAAGLSHNCAVVN